MDALALTQGEGHVFYRRSCEEMPAQEEEVKDAMEEGVKFHFYTTPVEILGKGEKVEKMRIQRMRPGEFDRSGRRRPVPIPNSEFDVKIDNVIEAIGQQPDVEISELQIFIE